MPEQSGQFPTPREAKDWPGPDEEDKGSEGDQTDLADDADETSDRGADESTGPTAQTDSFDDVLRRAAEARTAKKRGTDEDVD